MTLLIYFTSWKSCTVSPNTIPEFNNNTNDDENNFFLIFQPNVFYTVYRI